MAHKPTAGNEATGWSTRHVMAVVALLLLAYLVFLVVRPFATALVFAIVMVVVFQPLHVRIERHLRASFAAALTTMIVAFVIVVPAVAIATTIAGEAVELAGNVRALSFDAMIGSAHGYAARWGVNLEQALGNAGQQLTGQAGRLAARAIANTWTLFIGIVVAMLAMFFLFRDGRRALPTVVRAIPMSPALRDSLVSQVGDMIRSNIAASLVAASIQGTIGGLAFAWFALPAPVLWGAVMGFFCVFPVVGAWLVWAPAAAGLALSHRPWDALVLVGIGLAVVHPVDNLLRPAIVAHNTKLNGLLVLIGLLGGVQAFGPSGLLLGPVLISVAMGVVAAAADAEPSVQSWPIHHARR